MTENTKDWNEKDFNEAILRRFYDRSIDQFFQLEKEIWKLVGCDDDPYPGLEDGRQYSFYLDDDQIMYGIPGTDDYYGGDIYGTAIFRGKHFTIAVFDDGCGNRNRVILLDNTKAVSHKAFGKSV